MAWDNVLLTAIGGEAGVDDKLAHFQPFALIRHSYVAPLVSLVFILVALAVIAWVIVAVRVRRPLRDLVPGEYVRHRRAGELSQWVKGQLERAQARAEVGESLGPVPDPWAVNKLVDSFLRDYYEIFGSEFKRGGGAAPKPEPDAGQGEAQQTSPPYPAYFRAWVQANVNTRSSAARENLHPLVTPDYFPPAPPVDVLRQDWPELEKLLTRGAGAHEIAVEVGKRGEIHLARADYEKNHPHVSAQHGKSIARKRSLPRWARTGLLSCGCIALAVALVVPSALQIRNWNEERRAWQLQSQGGTGETQSVAIRTRLLERVLVPERWVVYYNLGTQYLQTAATDGERKTKIDAKYNLSQAYERLPYRLSLVDLDANRVRYACQVSYNYALAFLRASEAAEKIPLKPAVARSLSHSLAYCSPQAVVKRREYWEKQEKPAQLETFAAQPVVELAEKAEQLLEEFQNRTGVRVDEIKLFDKTAFLKEE